MDLAGLTNSAFLDRHGRFAKDEDQVDRVRLWFDGDSPDIYTEITYSEFKALDADDRRTIMDAGSGAGLVETAGVSNA